MIRRAAWLMAAVLATGIVVGLAFEWELLPSLIFALVVDLIVWELYDVWVFERAERKR